MLGTALYDAGSGRRRDCTAGVAVDEDHINLVRLRKARVGAALNDL